MGCGMAAETDVDAFMHELVIRLDHFLLSVVEIFFNICFISSY